MKTDSSFSDDFWHLRPVAQNRSQRFVTCTQKRVTPLRHNASGLNYYFFVKDNNF